MLDDLVRKARLIGAPGKYNYILVSKAGFNKECRDAAASYSTVLLDLNDIKELFDAAG
ncbi:MAG: hypothetical protein M1158_01560 [Candidatus Marsarchaeota archaeon]|nr:hypothetical protein [Candidatus Marsarchaeota archaeon]